MTPDGEAVRFDWRRGGAAAAGLLAALVLLGMVFLVAMSSDARERALAAERHSYDVALVVRNVSANISRAESALSLFVLDEDEKTSGRIYANDWQVAGFQIDQLQKLVRGSPEQTRRVLELKSIYERRGTELAMAARAAISGESQSGIGYFYSAQKSPTVEQLDSKLNEIITSERASLRQRIQQSQVFSAEADRFTDYLSWLGIIVGLGILLDTFVVRTVIIPALFTLIGPRIWWPALRADYGANDGDTRGRHRAGAGARPH